MTRRSIAQRLMWTFGVGVVCTAGVGAQQTPPAGGQVRLVPEPAREQARFQEPWIPKHMWAGDIALLFGGKIIDPRFEFMNLINSLGSGFSGLAGTGNGFGRSTSGGMMLGRGYGNSLGGGFNNPFGGGFGTGFGGRSQTFLGTGVGQGLGTGFGFGGNRWGRGG